MTKVACGYYFIVFTFPFSMLILDGLLEKGAVFLNGGVSLKEFLEGSRETLQGVGGPVMRSVGKQGS